MRTPPLCPSFCSKIRKNPLVFQNEISPALSGDFFLSSFSFYFPFRTSLILLVRLGKSSFFTKISQNR